MATVKELNELALNKRHYDSKIPGLFLVKRKRSSNYWMEYDDSTGFTRKILLCAGATALTDVRKLAVRYLSAASDPEEQDPSTKRLNNALGPTVDMVLDEFVSLKITGANITKNNYLRYEAHIRNETGKMLVRDIMAIDVQRAVNKVERGRYTFCYFLTQLFKFAQQNNYIKNHKSLVYHLNQNANKSHKEEQARMRTLSREEYKAIWEYVSDAANLVNPAFVVFVKLLLYFGVRPTFLRRLRKSQIRGHRILYRSKSGKGINQPGMFDLLLPPWLEQELKRIYREDTEYIFGGITPRTQWDKMLAKLNIKYLSMLDVSKYWVHTCTSLNFPIKLKNVLIGKPPTFEAAKEGALLVIHDALFE